MTPSEEWDSETGQMVPILLVDGVAYRDGQFARDRNDRGTVPTASRMKGTGDADTHGAG